MSGGPPAAPVLQVQGLHFAHAGQAPLFDGLSATLGPGLHWLQGESGSGKTTLLRLLAGELHCRGLLRLDGQVLAASSTAWRAAVCSIEARQESFDGLTPAALMAVVRQQHPALDEAAWQQHLDGFGLAPHAFKTLHMMSTGMRRKAALAAVLAAGCPLTLLDEPTAGLDGPAVAWLVQALAELGRQPRRAVLLACGHWPAGLACDGTWALPPP